MKRKMNLKKKIKLHRNNRYYHVKNRIEERYGIKLKNSEVDYLCCLIKGGLTVRSKNNVYVVDYKNVSLELVFDHVAGMISTALTPEYI